ncbi:MAG: hypothetical protein CL792_02645 [Chloroflexi bacterium]|nr:hypothetical protein [Chloroflexota bacterium]|tara:strand:+ start:1220 stop:2527 length:1308 start_codon:yes stop_codon:yes gene_type:complete
MSFMPIKFVGTDIPSAEDLRNCIHCGFCLPSCPTYISTGHELESPRGRLHLIDAVRSGRIDINDRLLGHLDLCLQCRACETACPSGVPYGRIMEDARASIMSNPRSLQPKQWRLRTFLLRNVIVRPIILRLAILPLRIYSKTRLQSLFRKHIYKWLPKRIVNFEALIPEINSKRFHQREILSSPDNASMRVALIMGCVQGEIFPQTHEATINVLEKLGCEVIAPPSQVCCGALHLHAGDMQKSRELARKNIRAFEEHQVDAIIVNAAGCGSTLKEYDHLLREDIKWSERAQVFSDKVEDILEFVAPRMQEENFQNSLSKIDINVTLQDSCHLAHAQGIRKAPRDILNQIPGINLHEMSNPDRCCGSAGIYSLVQSEMSNNILDTKMEDILTTESSIICTANPGCTLQLQSGVRKSGFDAEVLHVIELLNRSLVQK